MSWLSQTLPVDYTITHHDEHFRRVELTRRGELVVVWYTRAGNAEIAERVEHLNQRLTLGEAAVFQPRNRHKAKNYAAEHETTHAGD